MTVHPAHAAVTTLHIPGLAQAFAAAPLVNDGALAGTGAETLRVVLSLALVVVLILAAGWLGRRLQSRVKAGGRRLRCVESMAIGGKERVLLLQVGDKQVLVGAAPGGLRTLLVLDTPLDGGAADAAPAAAETHRFSELLAQWKKRP